MWVLAHHFFKDKSLHVADVVSWSEVEVGSRSFCVDVSLDIITMLAEAILEALYTSANIFIFWMVLAVVLDTLPVVDDVLVLAVDRTSNLVSVATHLSHYLASGASSVRTGRTLSTSMRGTTALPPAWCRLGCSCRSS